jgi:toxin FitB
VNYLIDTHIVSELSKGEACDRQVERWYKYIADDSVYLSVLVLGELRKGADLARPRDPAKAYSLDAWIAALTQSFRERILPIDRAVAEEWGRLNAIRPLPLIGSLLGATANVHAMTLVTRNVADLRGTGVELLNPFEPPKRGGGADEP